MSNADNEKEQIQSKIEQIVEHTKHCDSCKCFCNVKKETKEYVKRAEKNYRLRKLESDPKYAEQMQQKSKQYRENNKEQYNESMRIYMQKYRAKKKAEIQAASTPIQIDLENLTIKDEHLETSLAHNVALT